jgi:hypothetical protein
MCGIVFGIALCQRQEGWSHLFMGEPMESWLVTCRRRMGGTVQFAAAWSMQLFEAMLGKHATLRWYGQSCL